jgi:hypothetical protein
MVMLAIRSAMWLVERLLELPFRFHTIGAVPQARTPCPDSEARAKHRVGSLNQAHLSAALENSIVAARQL